MEANKEWGGQGIRMGVRIGSWDASLSMVLVVLLSLSGYGCTSCSSEPDAPDGGDDAGVNGEPDQADSERQGDDFGLWIPSSTQACPLGIGFGLADQLRLKGRVFFKPGLVSFPRDADRFEADLIEELALTPGQGVAEPEGSGEFNRTFVGDPLDGTARYIFEQTYRVGGQQLFLSAEFLFDLVAGEPQAPLWVLDPQGMLELLSVNSSWLRIAFADGYEMGMFLSCDVGSYRLNEYEFTMSDGATLLLTEWMAEVPGWFMFCAAGLTEATYTQGQATRAVDDFWHLAYSPGNHNIIEFFAIRFDPPLGDVHGLEIYSQSLGEPLEQLTSIYTLDASLAKDNELPISSAVYRGVPCLMPNW